MNADTNDVALARAIQRKSELEDELQKVNLFLEMYQHFRGMRIPENQNETASEAQSERVPPSLPLTPSEGAVHTAPGAENMGGVQMPQPEFESLVREILIGIGKPMSAKFLLERFHERGRYIAGNDELKNFTTKLWRAKGRITKISGAGYWPSDLPCAQVGYSPREEQLTNDDDIEL